MCLRASVGYRGHNRHEDVVALKVLLNAAWRLRDEHGRALNGHCDRALIARIAYFQERYMRQEHASRCIAPRSSELLRLRRMLRSGFDADKLTGIMPRATPARVARYCKHLVTEMALRSIHTPLRRAHFLAQLAVESDGLVFAEERASGDAYEGRADLGNTHPGDGRRCKGRGLIQLTGRNNYKAYGDSLGMDLASKGAWTQVATDPVLAVGAAGWFWETRKLNDIADMDEIYWVTRVVNGGLNGIEDRLHYLYRARYFLVA